MHYLSPCNSNNFIHFMDGSYFISFVINVAFIVADPSAASQIRSLLFKMVQIVERDKHRVVLRPTLFLKHLFTFITYMFFS
jgi:hypothetical protein